MFITVFTPTFNRAHLLPRLYESLLSQTCSNFEWIVVDDESQDNTDAVIYEFKNREHSFPIRYYKQPHGGKHRAMNFAVREAKGEYFFTVDSDDWLPDDAVENVIGWLESIQGIPELCGVAGQKMLPDETIVGTTFSSKAYIDASSLDRKKERISGDKAEVFSTTVLRNHPFPEFENEFFVTESVCWNAIAADGYKLRWFQIPIYYCEYLEDGLTCSGVNELSGHIANFKGFSFYVRQSLQLKKRYEGYRDYANFQQTCDALGLSGSERAEALGWSKMEYLVNRSIVMPLVHQIKRVVFVSSRMRTLIKKKVYSVRGIQ